MLAPLPVGPLVVLVALAWVAAVALPLATYTLTLALFGLAHVASELAYLQRRFGPWLGSLILPLGLVLMSIASMRALALLGVVPWGFAQRGELLAGALLVLVVAPRWLQEPLAGRVAGPLVAGALVVGLLWLPIHALLAVAVLHNWTPVPLLAEALEPSRRRRLYAVAAAVFVGLPLLIATGLPWSAIAALGMGSIEAGLLPSGSLAANQGAYLPKELSGWTHSQHLFSAVVFAQCLHYIAVIGVLPRLGPNVPAGPRSGRWLVVLGTAVLFVGYLLDFRVARSTYGVVASIHAWIEVPLLLLALLPSAGAREPTGEFPRRWAP